LGSGAPVTVLVSKLLIFLASPRATKACASIEVPNLHIQIDRPLTGVQHCPPARSYETCTRVRVRACTRWAPVQQSPLRGPNDFADFGGEGLFCQAALLLAKCDASFRLPPFLPPPTGRHLFVRSDDRETVSAVRAWLDTAGKGHHAFADPASGSAGHPETRLCLHEAVLALLEQSDVVVRNRQFCASMRPHRSGDVLITNLALK
jgi:hypothetical protein